MNSVNFPPSKTVPPPDFVVDKGSAVIGSTTKRISRRLAEVNDLNRESFKLNLEGAGIEESKTYDFLTKANDRIGDTPQITEFFIKNSTLTRQYLDSFKTHIEFNNEGSQKLDRKSLLIGVQVAYLDAYYALQDNQTSTAKRIAAKQVLRDVFSIQDFSDLAALPKSIDIMYGDSHIAKFAQLGRTIMDTALQNHNSSEDKLGSVLRMAKKGYVIIQTEYGASGKQSVGNIE